MLFAQEINLKKVIAFSQWDKIVITLVATCAMPMLFHAFPLLAGPELGRRWLPMFYAPLIASLCFRPHVSLLVGLGAPVINHVVFGMPDSQALPVLVFELAVFNLWVALLSARRPVRGWQVVPIFIGVRALSLLIFVRPFADTFPEQFLHSFWVAWPGVVLLAVLAEIVGRWMPRRV